MRIAKKPIEIIIALKNMVHDKNFSPKNVNSIIKSVMQTGRTVVLNETAKRRREELGLPPLKSRRDLRPHGHPVGRWISG